MKVEGFHAKPFTGMGCGLWGVVGIVLVNPFSVDCDLSKNWKRAVDSPCYN